ncbi:uncharacterized protein LOC103510544, partial [Diaphorina citri]|uniref:Uncharacterized protein LOC103510544 n=1 Tax=Diaphorina citri TaxID=121845 RepID=A0A3Q0J107_DIACI
SALFAAVEHGHVDKTRTILESADVNVNSMNSDGFTPLDVAILSNNLPLVKLLISFGAQEGNKFSSPDKLGAHLRHLLLESERRCHELGGTCLLDHNSHHHSTLSINRGSISVADSDRSDKTLALWERRCKGLKKMLLGFDQASNMNSDGFTPLDVAILSNNLPLVKLLITFGAQEGNKFSSPDKLGAHLRHLLLESERRCHELGGTCLLDHNSHHHSTLSINRGSISVADSDRSDKTLALWERRCKGLKKMLLGFDQARPPDMPSSVSVEVTGITSVCVRYQEPDNSASPLCTKYKVEWSTDPDFKDIVGSQEILNSRQHDLEISNLIHRQRYYFRAACGNIRGYSLPKVSTPSHVEPSSWRDCSGLIKTERISSDGLALLDRLFGEMKNERPDLKTFSEAVENGGGDCGKRKKTTIKQLFTAASKFQKHLKRGVFLSCLLYHEDKVLVTNEDFLPVIEIDDTYPNSIYQDFHWLLKVSCTWEDIKLLRNEMEKSLSNSNTSNHFRVKLLNASLQMQTALSIENLGIRGGRDVVPCRTLQLAGLQRPHQDGAYLQVLRSCNSNDKLNSLTEQQRMFLEHVALTLKRLFRYMEVSDEDCALHRLYDSEVIEISAEVSLVMIVPPVESACSVPGQRELLLQRPDLLPLPVQVFEMVSCTWEDIKLLRNEMEKSLSNSNTSNHFRVKLLNASLQMQTALSIENLGQLYHRPIKDSEGTIVIPLINYVKNVKSISVLNSRWLPLTKLTKRTNLCNLNENNVSEMLMASVQDQITYHQVSRIKLSKGLYLGYLKMRSSVDLLQVLVPSKSPNVPPHCKVRDNPHVTADEWEVLRSCNSNDKLNSLTEQQRMFLEHVALTLKRLFRYMEVSDEDCALHRLYDSEVIEISAEVSLVMIVPPVESACSVPGQRELLLQRPDLLPLPVQVFEMVHLGTYQRSLVSKYSRLSCILQLDTALAQQGHREAFSNTEVSLAKERLSRLETLQSRLNTTWKQTRWLLDVLSFARDRLSSQCPPSVKYLLSLCNSSTETSSSSCVSMISGLPALRPNTNKLAPSRSDDVLIQHTQAPPTNTTRTSSSATTSPLLATRLQGCLDISSRSCLYTLVQVVCLPMIATHTTATSNFLSCPPYNLQHTSVTPSLIPQVYAAYNTGLAPGTSLMLHVSPRTCAREVVNLVVKEVNMAVLVKGKSGPIYSQEELSNFCLVAVLGPRERCLRDDFKPLQLQNPWKKGRLYVRQKHDKLAALDQSSRHSTFL